MADQDLDLDDDIEDDIEDDDAPEAEEPAKESEPEPEPDGHADASDTEASDPASEEKRKRRAEERKVRREMRKQARFNDKLTIQRLRNELQEVKRTTESVVNRMQTREAEDIDSRLSSIELKYNNAKRISKEAFDKGDGAAFTQAQEVMNEARDEYYRTQAAKQQRTQAKPETRQAPGVDGTVRDKALKWTQSVRFDSWLPKEKELAQVIDKEMAEEGFDPKSDSYYDELTKRLRDYVPERLRPNEARPQAAAARTKPGSPTAGGGGERAVTGNNADKGLPREYIERCQRAGMWDTPEDKKEMRAAYFEAQKQYGGKK